MKTTQSSSARVPMTALAASIFCLLFTPAAAAGLKLRSAAPPAAAPAPAPAPGPAPPPIRPGVAVRVTKSKEQLQKDFEGQEIRYVPAMDNMLGKDYVVREMKYGAVGVASPDGKQEGTWYFPMASVKPWTDTQTAKEPPVASKAFKAAGLPTHARVEVGPPARGDAPWEYKVTGRSLMDPIAPPLDYHVDLETSGMPMPPYMKVKQVKDIECLEKMHKDPHFVCKPEHYIDYEAVKPPTTTEKPLTKEEAKVLKDHIKHLKATIKSLTPKEQKKTEIEVPGMTESEHTMTSAVSHMNKKHPEESGGKKMKIGKEGSDERLHTAQGYGEKKIKTEKHAKQPPAVPKKEAKKEKKLASKSPHPKLEHPVDEKKEK